MQREMKHSTTDLIQVDDLLLRRETPPIERCARRQLDSEGDLSSEHEPTLRYHARRKYYKDEETETETEDETEENIVVNELLEKYTTGFNDM